jgi:predicted alpha-1,2-mannosidase
MKAKFIYLIVLITLLSSCKASHTAKQESVLQYVDPDIGTAHSRWFFYTPAALPYGMAKLSPSTNGHYGNASGWEAVGYDVRHNSIEGFVQFHEWQIGGVNIMPTNGPLKVKPGDLENPDEGYRSRFDRKNEVSGPGYYKVLLDDYNITAELTTTKRVGFHRFTFPEGNESRVILDIGNRQGESGEVRDAAVRMIDDTHFEGFVTTYPKYIELFQPSGEVSMYFWGEISKKPAKVGAFTAAGIQQNAIAAKGKGAGLFLEFATKGKEAIEVKVGLSYTSTENAKENFLAEATGVSFEQAKRRAQNIWQGELSKLYVEGSNEKNKVKFYTGLFHALLGRGIANDVDGSFPQNDGTIGQLPLNADGSPKHNILNTDAIWGAFWNLTQLWALAYPEHYNDYVQTQLAVYKNGGWFGDGLANGQYVSGVGTNFVGLALVGAYNIGLRDYDVDLAYKAIKGNELNWRDRKVGAGKMDLKGFIDHGFVPHLDENRNDSTGSNFSASHTLEYSFSSYAAAQMAKQLGNTEDYKLLMDHSKGWEELYDSTTQFIRPKKADGTFIKDFDPYQPWRGFQEGNAWQYTFYVPQNPASLIAKLGREEFNNRLEKIFETAQETGFGGGKEIDAFAGVKTIYNHGNQPSLHISWLFNFSGKPWLTQKWTRAICDEFYGTEGVHGYGYGQDEDQGQLGSWYVMSALGLFDVKGFTDARPIVEIGSPLFDKATIQLGNQKVLVIETENNSKDNVYIQSATFNGEPLNNCWLYRDELMKGGKLEFVMGSQPNKDWGTRVPPPSMQ